MKNFSIFVLTALLCETNAMASNKICFGSTKDVESKGVVLFADFTPPSRHHLKAVKGEAHYGTFAPLETILKEHDGHT